MTAPDTISGRLATHVLTITPFYPKEGNEGSGCFVAEPLQALAKVGVQSTVFAVEPFYRGQSHQTASAPDAEWYRYAALPAGMGLSSAGVGLYLRLRRLTERLHAKSPVTLIHAHGALPCGHAAMFLSRRLDVPYVVTVHGLDAFSTRQVSGLPGVACERISRRVYADARNVIGVSQHVCDEIQKGTGGRARVSAVYNGVDPAVFTPGDDPAEPLMLTVGNLIPTKGHELVVQALAGLRPEFPTLTWEVIGDGPERNRIQQLAESLEVQGNIRFRGRQNRTDVAEAFRRCTVFVLPSGYEGLGCVYLEAMASGKVAMGCVGQGIDEIIRHGENGWLVRPESREDLTAGLRVLLRDEDRRRRIAAEGRRTILQSLTLGHQALRLLEVYRESLR